MLSLLHIENIAVIERADIQFDPGFNALTGETGAGKSIVIDAISAVLGERTSRELIRTGAKSALVNAVFTGVSAAGLAGGERRPGGGGAAPPAGDPGGRPEYLPGGRAAGDRGPAAGAGASSC